MDRSVLEENIGTLRICVIGVGGAGSNAVDNMIRSGIEGVTFIVCNTDAQALKQSLCAKDHKIHLGRTLTQGLGAGACPEVGRAATEESLDEIAAKIEGNHMAFVLAGMGGGTGTGGAPVIAGLARKQKILTVGVVTKPFDFEGPQRMKTAEKGVEAMKAEVDTLLVIPNQNLFRLAKEETTLSEAFLIVDNNLRDTVGIFADLVSRPGIVNVDFADVRAIMQGVMGKAMMGTGEASGEGRAIEAAERAIACPLLEDSMMGGAEAVLINITGGADLTLSDVDAAAHYIRKEVSPDANIIFGASYDESLKGYIRVSVVATGIDCTKKAVFGSAPAPVLPQHSQPEKEELPLSPLPGTVGYEGLGNRHGEFSFPEQNFAPFALREEGEVFGEDPRGGHLAKGGYPEEEEEKPSFLKRLLWRRGRKEAAWKNPQDKRDSRDPAYYGPRFASPKSAPEELSPEELEVPAFLRKNKRGPL